MTGNLKKSWKHFRNPSGRAQIVVAGLAALVSAFVFGIGLSKRRPLVGTPPQGSMTSSEGEQSGAPQSEEPTGQRRRRHSGTVAASLIVAGLILLLGFAPASRLAARNLPELSPGVAPTMTDPPHGKATGVRAVPVGLPRGARIKTTRDVLPYAVAALGPSQAVALIKALKPADKLGGGPVGDDSDHLKYPYRYPDFDAVVKKAPPASFASAATALGAALTVLAAQPSNWAPGTIESNAGAAAYSVLNRARAAGGCAPQLDLLLLLTADPETSMDHIRREEQHTESACPHDPTPGWLFGQSQLRILPQSAISIFRRLAAEYPGDPGVLSGLGDAYLRAGTYLRFDEPFTARQDFRSAVAEYNRVMDLGDARDAAPGLARALIGLSEPVQAARLLRPLASASAFPGPFLELLITADEAAHDFGDAAMTARRLDQLGVRAYPDGIALFPAPPPPPMYQVDVLDDTSLPLSFGADRLAPLSAALINFYEPAEGGGSGVLDLSFIPEYRDSELTGTDPYCPSWAWRRDAALTGHLTAASAGWPVEFTGARPGFDFCSFGDTLKQIAVSQANRTVNSSASGYDLRDDWQNLLRWAGNLRAARKVAEQWQAAVGDKAALPALRLGEIEFLMHQYNEAAAEFGLAARRFRLLNWNNNLAVEQAELDRGTALLAAGRASEGTQLLRPLDLLGTQGYASQNDSETPVHFAAVSYYACEQLADYERESGNLHAAVEDYTTALDWVQKLEGNPDIRPEVLYNNAALAYLGLGDTSTAASLERKALAVDPMNPAFLMTAGFIADRAGRIAEAARYDRETLASAPDAFPAANDLGVELSREHHDSGAVTALRQAVGASQGYALGWFNLGVLESKRGPWHLLASQGAFAFAYTIEAALKDRRPDMTIDAKTYRTALDLSKPLPPKWGFSQLQRPTPAAAVGLLTIVSLALGLAKASSRGGNTIAGQWLDPISERLQSASWVPRLVHPGWALAATLASFLFAYLRRAADITEIVTYALGVLLLSAAAMTARASLARRCGIRITQSSWAPAMALGLVTGAIGLPWAPLPVVRTDGDDDPRLHLAAPLILAALSLLLFVESAWLHTPITQAWAVAALIMSASTLLPISPLDGAHVGKAGILPAVGIAGGALLLGLGLI